MPLTLDAALAAAQDNPSRHLLAEITSSQRNEDIPFDGAFLTSETFNEFGANLIPHSSGRLCIAYCYGPDADGDCGIKYVYTDTERREFTPVTIELYTDTSRVIVSVSICELTGGNIGLVYLINDTVSHLYRLIRRIVTVTGAAVGNAEIVTWSHDTFTSDPWVQTLGANSYLLVYGKKSGSNYYLYKRTSNDFVTWSAEAALSIAGLTSTWRLSNPSIIKITTGDLWLWFDVLESTGPGGEQLTNIYYSVSTNGGTTWTAAVRVTNYDGYGEVGGHPVAVQKASNQMNLIFTRKVGALHMDDTATGWPTGDTTVELSWDSTNRKLYAVNIHNGFATKGLQCVVKIDVDTWTVDQYWDATTTPGFPAVICGGSSATEHVWYCNHVHDGHIIAITAAHIGSSGKWLWVLDGEANTITNYYCDANVAYGFTQNVTHSISADYGSFHHCQVDAANLRVYLCLVDTYVWHPKVSVGYIDLTESSPEFHEIFNYTDIDDTEAYGVSYSLHGGMWVDVDSGYIVLSCSTGMWPGAMLVFDLETGALIVKWTGSDIDFPYYGLTKPFVYNGKIYAGMCKYTSGYDQGGFRGLAEIDISAETITLHRPSYCSSDDHYFGRPSLLQDGRIAMTHTSYGVAVFDTISKTWSLFSNNNIAGFTADGKELASPSQIAYDDTNDMIMVGDAGVYGGRNPQGVIMFSANGYIRQASYAIGTNPGGGWSFSEAGSLVQGFLDYDAAAAVEPGTSTSAYVFWTHEGTDGEKSIKWDKDGSTVDLSPYIAGEVATEQTISGQPATLSFSVSHGHLFDPYNLSSLLNPVLKKGRKIVLRWGENIGGVDYWQNAGTFFVTGTSLDFQRGEYPIMQVIAEDQRCLWQHGHVYATDVYNNLPGDILTDLLIDLANMTLEDINLPAFAGETRLQMQWIESTLDEIITQVCERFGYYFRFDCDGRAHARRISNTAGIDHIYPDNTKLIKYSPDDKYSDFTNRVTVRGQEMDFTTVQYAEERITQLSGTLGWWGCKADHVVWFSDDKSRRCLSPRLVALETSTSIPFQLAGGVDEYIEECAAGDDYKFCTVYIKAPNLIGMLAASIALYIVGNKIGDAVVSWGAGWTQPVGRLIEGLAVMPALMILGSTASYQLEVWATPLGSLRRSVQGSWNDEEHQTEIKAVVEQVVDDPLCYSVADCVAVASFEGMVAQMQRRRVTITKVAHLQDEDGDTIRVTHPYSGENLDLFVASLKRTFKKADAGSDGYFSDEIEGWVVS